MLHADVVAAAIHEALEDLRRPKVLERGQEEALKAELRAVETELANLTSTVRAAGPLPSVVSALKAAEERKVTLQRTLRPTRDNSMNAARLQKLIDDWRAMFRDNVAITRQNPRATA